MSKSVDVETNANDICDLSDLLVILTSGDDAENALRGIRLVALEISNLASAIRNKFADGPEDKR